jgi:hypothetical protein
MSPLEEEYEKKGVAFLLVNAYDEPASARSFIGGAGKDRPWAFADEAALRALGVHAAPTQVLVDREGRVAWTSSFGTMSEGAGAVRKALDSLLKAN